MHTSRLLLLPSLILLLLSATAAQAAADKMLRISTDNTDLILHVVSDGRIYQTYFGERLADPPSIWDTPLRKTRNGRVSTAK